jgi:mRNA-degrading endonuclease toxin of MazEF toxin-antitoxin module
MLTPGDIVELDLGAPAGSEDGLRRPAVVVTAARVLRGGPTVVQVRHHGEGNRPIHMRVYDALVSLMERRLQLLLDQERYSRVAREASRSGRSVAAVIREAIDLRFAESTDSARARAAEALLELTATPVGAGEGPAELKAAYAAQLDEAMTHG